MNSLLKDRSHHDYKNVLENNYVGFNNLFTEQGTNQMTECDSK